MARALLRYGRDPIGTFRDLAQRYGDLARLAGPPFNTFLVNRAEYIEDVLVTRDWNFSPVRPYSFARAFRASTSSSEGYHHQRHRALFAPTLYRDRISGWGAMVAGCARRLAERWTEGEELDIEREMARLTPAVMGELFFGPDVRSDPAELEAAITATEYLGTRTTHPAGIVVEALPVVPSTRRFWAGINYLDRKTRERIARRRARGETGDDLLGLLLAARDPDTDKGIADAQIRDELISIYMVPSILMGKALTWTWYLLGEHPAVEAKLHAEVDAVLGGGLGTGDAWPHLPYTWMVLQESMRLYPPSWIVARKAVQDYDLDGYRVPAGGVIALCASVTHHDPRYFPAPERFDPERWTAAALAARPKWSYFPFSAGPRNCLGEHFAELAMVLMLATLAQEWRPRPVPGQRVEPQARFALRPAHGLRVRLERRRTAATAQSPAGVGAAAARRQ
jgi:cytochrome P450